MKRFIYSQNKTYDNILNICEDNEGVITFKNGNGEVVTENSSDLPAVNFAPTYRIDTKGKV